MSQSLPIPDDLISSAQQIAARTDRTLASQIEHLLRLGMSIDELLHQPSFNSDFVSTAISTVTTPAGQQRLLDYLDTQPYPHFEPSPDDPTLIIKIEQDGTRTTGRFVDRRFVPIGRVAGALY